jgi:ankyrin repeat protein
MHAAKEGHADIVELLLNAGANKNIADVDGKKAIDFAVEQGNHVIVVLLSNEPAAGAA